MSDHSRRHAVLGLVLLGRHAREAHRLEAVAILAARRAGYGRRDYEEETAAVRRAAAIAAGRADMDHAAWLAGTGGAAARDVARAQGILQAVAAGDPATIAAGGDREGAARAAAVHFQGTRPKAAPEAPRTRALRILARGELGTAGVPRELAAARLATAAALAGDEATITAATGGDLVAARAAAAAWSKRAAAEQAEEAMARRRTSSRGTARAPRL